VTAPARSEGAVEEQVDARARNDDREFFQELRRLEAIGPRSVAPPPPQAQQHLAVWCQLERVLRTQDVPAQMFEPLVLPGAHGRPTLCGDGDRGGAAEPVQVVNGGRGRCWPPFPERWRATSCQPIANKRFKTAARGTARASTSAPKNPDSATRRGHSGTRHHDRERTARLRGLLCPAPDVDSVSTSQSTSPRWRSRPSCEVIELSQEK
jgi:hypothetical protein